ncbi:MAG: hypothetical protein H6737_03210 [Alphaproteobacteria bacterium]|nr:hypothetical protein [Alphaproteobacteria bacterium]
METTGPGIALLAAGCLFGGLLVERVLLAIRWRPYFRLGFPLGQMPVPVARMPEGAGETRSVKWEVRGDEVLFWAEPGSRAAPMGLHGHVQLAPARGRVALHVSWAPPWSPVLAALWLAVLGLVRGEGWLTVPVGSAMLVGIAVLYWRSAVMAARELRWAFVKGDE